MILTFLLEVRNLDGLCIEQLTQLKPVQDREGIIGADPWPGLWFTVESARGLVGGRLLCLAIGFWTLPSALPSWPPWSQLTSCGPVTGARISILPAGSETCR